jgi:GntR family transcriptional regulator/MocR family aminotransferase
LILVRSPSMASVNRTATLLTVDVDPTAATPLFRQLYDGFRRRILDGALPPGMRLPATRALADELRISRNTVLNAYEQLLAEGYLEGRAGSGTYVPPKLPEEMMQVRQKSAPSRPVTAKRRGLSRRGQLLARSSVRPACVFGPPRPLQPGVPALDAFPFEEWGRLVARRYRRPPRELLDYNDPAGYAPLRKAIAAHLGPARGVNCEPEQVLVITGSQQGIDLIARILLDPGDTAWVEDPGYLGARAALAGAGARVVGVPVDDAGLDVSAGNSRCRNARLVHVTPSHQYPLGVTLTLSRRLALLDWARRANAWIIEDDYDSEFRYAGRPLAALQGMDRDGRVLYLGTFSKALFPSLRLGYLVVPSDLVGAFVAARAVMDRQTPTLTQAVAADFLNEGHFVRHIRRMRTLYSQRQETLLRAAKRELVGLVRVSPCETGMHVMGWLEDGRQDRNASRAATQAGVEAPPLSSYRIEHNDSGGLLLGYAGWDARQIRDGVRRLGQALRDSP